MANTIYVQYFQTPVGELILGAFQDQLCLCDWRYRKMRDAVDQRLSQFFTATFEEADAPVLETTRQQLNAYFAGTRQKFELPLCFAGTPFQQRVWQALCDIPFGKTMSYLALSQQLGNEKAIRAVASANGANAISIIVPCHRVVGSNGELTGYAGGLEAKKKLLELEHALPKSNEMQLALFG